MQEEIETISYHNFQSEAQNFEEPSQGVHSKVRGRASEKIFYS